MFSLTYKTLAFYVLTFIVVQVFAFVYQRRTHKPWARVQIIALAIWAISLYGNDSNKPDTPPPDPPQPPEKPSVRVYRLVKFDKHWRLMYDPKATAKKILALEAEESAEPSTNPDPIEEEEEEQND